MSLLLDVRPPVWLLLACVVWLQGCANRSPAPSAAGAAPAARPASPAATSPPAAPRASPLDTERQWLQTWFEGTPVEIAQDDGVLNVAVPRAFCFDSGRSAVKPPLGAVLDKLAESLRRHPQLRLERVAAPDDGAAAPGLAIQRAAQVRSHLRARGVAESRLGNPSRSSADAVQLRLLVAAR